MQPKIIERTAFLRSGSDELTEKRQAEFVISTEAVDSYNTVFKMDGWDLKRYAKNPIVCYQHRSNSDDPDDIIGVSELFIEDGQLIGRVTFEDEEINPKAEKIRKKVLAGTLKMASVGARVLKAHRGDKEKGEDENVYYFDRSELVEWSIVSAGANPEAHKRNMQTLEDLKNEIATEEARDITAFSEDISEQTNTEQKEEPKRMSVLEARYIINKNKAK